jgi:P4 family phage/plasmid primase-like protien
MEPKQLNSLLAGNIPALFQHLYGYNPAVEVGGIWSMGDVKGAQGDSLKVWGNGTFKDFGTSGHQGDLINLTALALELSFPEAIRDLKAFLGVTETSFTAPMKEVEAEIQKLQSGPQWKPLPSLDPWKEGFIQGVTRPDHVYLYTARDATPIFVVGRWDAVPIRKKFFQIVSYRAEGWVTKAPDITLWPLYGETDLVLSKSTVIVVEGEKAVEWGRNNFPQYYWTTWHGGASAVKRTDFISLTGKQVILWPDNDEVGLSAMKYVRSVVPSALMLQPLESWDNGADVADLSPEVVQAAITETLTRVVVPEEPEPQIHEDHMEPNQLGSVYRFIDRYAKDMRFLAEAKVWTYWDGRKWATDRGGYAWSRAVKTVEGALADTAGWVGKDKKRATRALFYSQIAKGTGHIKGVIEGASLMPGVPVSETDFDKEEDVINCLNGVVDLRTGRVYPHARERMMTKLVEYPYEPGSVPTMFLTFLNEIMQGDKELVDFLQVYFGYALTGLPPDRIFTIFYGSGRNGKSTLIQIISKIMQDYHVTIRSQSIMSGREGERPDKIGEDLIPMRGARLVTMQESDKSTRLNEGKIKELTGRDMMRCRYLHSNLWLQFVNTGKIILTTNHRPRITGQDPGIWDRVAMVPFEARIPEDKIDPDLSAKILESEASAVLSWMVDGAIRFYASGKKIVRPKAVIEATDDYRSDEDMLGKFVEECLHEDKAGRVKVSTLMEVYKHWMDVNGDRNSTLGSRRFAEDIRPVMERYGYLRKKTGDGTYYFGCSLLDTEQMEIMQGAKKDLPELWSNNY